MLILSKIISDNVYFMPAKKYKVTLSEAERKSLLALIKHGQGPAKKLLHARILLQADQGPSGPAANDQDISLILHTSRATVERVRQAFVPPSRGSPKV